MYKIGEVVIVDTANKGTPYNGLVGKISETQNKGCYVTFTDKELGLAAKPMDKRVEYFKYSDIRRFTLCPKE